MNKQDLDISMSKNKEIYLYYPGHGVGVVQELKNQKYEGMRQLKLLRTGVTVMFPESNKNEIGIRSLMTKRQAEELLLQAQNPNDIKMDTRTWNRRYREYMGLVRNGNPEDLAKVVNTLNGLKKVKELSFGEKKMLEASTDMLMEEINLVLYNEVN